MVESSFSTIVDIFDTTLITQVWYTLQVLSYVRTASYRCVYLYTGLNVKHAFCVALVRLL